MFLILLLSLFCVYSQLIYNPVNDNGDALNCIVPQYNNAKVVQVYRSTWYGSRYVTNINCREASVLGIGIDVTDSMYAVTKKCIVCNCCWVCLGIDAVVCMGNSNPRQNNKTVGSWWIK